MDAKAKPAPLSDTVNPKALSVKAGQGHASVEIMVYRNSVHVVY